MNDLLSKYKERLNQLNNGSKELYIGEIDNIKAIVKALNEVYNGIK